MNYQRAIEEIPITELAWMDNKVHPLLMRITAIAISLPPAGKYQMKEITNASPDWVYEKYILPSKEGLIMQLESHVLMLARFIEAQKKTLDRGMARETRLLENVDISSSESLYWITFLRLVVNFESIPFKGDVIGEMLARINVYADRWGVSLPRQRELYMQYLNHKNQTL